MGARRAGGEGRTIRIWQQLLYFDSQQLATVIVCWVWRNKQCESLALIDTVEARLSDIAHDAHVPIIANLHNFLRVRIAGEAKAAKIRPSRQNMY